MKLDLAKEKDFRRGELLEKYIWDDGKFKKEYLKRLEEN